MTHKEVTVATAGELEDGEMKQVSVNETDILLARVKGKYHAVGAHCTHYGAPLVEGALSNERIVCPWHHACFNVTTGDLEEPPALDSLPCYEVRVDGESVIVSLPDEATDRRTPAMTKRDSSSDGRLFVILGGGAAGYAAAQALREDGFQGRILMITREDRTPYDRPNLSKDYLQGHAEPKWMPLREDEFYAEHTIEVLREKEVARVDAAKKTITFTDGDTLAYDSLLIATGGTPRRLNVPGSDLKNIFVLRGFADTDAIIEAAPHASHAVGIGKMRGVGWAICYQNPANGRLSNHWITLHETGNVSGFTPVLVMDVWEHAFLLDYKPAERPKYIEAFFSNIDWEACEERLRKGAAARSSAA